MERIRLRSLNKPIFCIPNLYDAFPLVNLEAMEYKLPIVTTDEGGIPDVVKNGENGLIAKKKDAVSLADCMEKLLEDKDCAKNGGERLSKVQKQLYPQCL